MSGNRFGVLFVCTGNICRSPTAEAVFRKLAAQAGLAQVILADSAGTHGYHIGEPPDPRAQDAAAKRGYDLSGLRARGFERVLDMLEDAAQGLLESLRIPGRGL